MRQLFLVLLLVMFASTSVFAEGLGVHAALQQANSRTRIRTITSQVNISFLSSHDLPSHNLEDDGISDWLAYLLFGVGGAGVAVFGIALNSIDTEVRNLFPVFFVSGGIVGVSGLIAFFRSLF